MAQTQSDATSRQDRAGAQMQPQTQSTRSPERLRRDPFLNPFALLGRLVDEMSGVFTTAGIGPGRERFLSSSGLSWAPDVDVVQRGNELVVRADLPGVDPDDIDVEISDDAITLSGDRSEEREEERNGVYRVERRYGSFYRVIPLPEGAITDQAKASFNHGVLEVVVPAPSEQVSRGRRLQIERGSTTQQGQQPQSKGTGKSEAAPR